MKSAEKTLTPQEVRAIDRKRRRRDRRINQAIGWLIGLMIVGAMVGCLATLVWGYVDYVDEQEKRRRELSAPPPLGR